MAILVGSVLGNFKGKLGNLYARCDSGRTIFAAMPSSFNDANTDEQQSNRKKLAVSAKFCSGINNNPYLRKLWKMHRPKYFSAFNYMVAENAKLVSDTAPTEDNISAPPEGFPFNANDIILTDYDVTATIPPLSSLISIPSEATNVIFTGTLTFLNPNDEKYAPFVTTEVTKSVPGYNYGNPYSFIYSLNNVQRNLLTAYQRSMFHFSVIITDASGSEYILHSDSIGTTL